MLLFLSDLYILHFLSLEDQKNLSSEELFTGPVKPPTEQEIDDIAYEWLKKKNTFIIDIQVDGINYY